MQVEINSRHFNLGDESREKIAADLQKLERFSPRPPVLARLTLTNESGRFTADLAFMLRANDFRARAQGIEPELAADEAIENIKTQLRRFKGKLSGRQKGGGGGLGRALASEGDESPAYEGATLQADRFELQDLTVDEAVDVCRDSDFPFVVFRNQESARLSVVYRHADGTFGLLEAATD